MFIHPWDSGTTAEGLSFARRHGFGELIAGGRNRDVPVVAPTQFVLVDDGEVVLHLLRRNPIWGAIDENPRVLLAVSGEWAFIPSDWKVVPGEDPRGGIPTTYYSSVQLTGVARAVSDPEGVAAILRTQLSALQPGVDVIDPLEHGTTLNAIRAMTISLSEVRAKFKYGGNVDAAHRRAVADHLEERRGPGDLAAASQVRRRLGTGAEPPAEL